MAIKWIALLFLVLITTVRADLFTGSFLKSAAWKDGKAEFNLYDARQVRYGVQHPSEVIHIVVSEKFAAKTLVKSDKWDAESAYHVLKLNQILHIPTGIYVYQQMHSSFWNLEDGRLLKWTLTSNDSCGNTFKIGERTGNEMRMRYFTYWENMVEGELTFPLTAETVFYDELPLWVRTLDFTKPSGEKSFLLAPTTITSKNTPLAFTPAKVSWKQEGKRIVLTISSSLGSDRFWLKAESPHLLLEWRQANGGQLTLRRSLKLPYWEYNQPGDAEKVLKDPRLQQ